MIAHKMKRLGFFAAVAGTSTALAVNNHNSNNINLLDFQFPCNFSFSSGVNAAVRSCRAVSTIAVTVVDYKYSLRGVGVETEEYRVKVREVHERSAKRILTLCEANKGFYIKAAQFVASLRQVPVQFSSTFSTLQDQAAPSPFHSIKQVIISNLGQDPSNIFLCFDEQPIAAASIAQVHHAVLSDLREVAVKVQYPGLESQMKLDVSIMSLLSKSVSRVFPDYRFDWLVSEFKKTISSELDFIQEAKNSERTARNFKSNSIVRIPSILWELTTRRVLTMQFCSGHKINDVGFLKESGINPTKVAEALTEVFSEMVFLHGFVHADPHPGNILVSPGGSNGFSLVLLDHGIYKELDETFRKDYCLLWKAMILRDLDTVQHVGEHFGVGKYSKYFPVIFLGKPIDSKSALGKGMSSEEKGKLKQELKSLKMEDISSFMESLPSDLLTILRVDGLLKSVIGKMGGTQRMRLFTYAKHALYGLSTDSKPESGSGIKAAATRLKTHMTYIHLRLTLEAVNLMLRMDKVKHFLYMLFRRLSPLLEWRCESPSYGKGKSLLALLT